MFSAVPLFLAHPAPSLQASTNALPLYREDPSAPTRFPFQRAAPGGVFFIRLLSCTHRQFSVKVKNEVLFPSTPWKTIETVYLFSAVLSSVFSKKVPVFSQKNASERPLVGDKKERPLKDEKTPRKATLHRVDFSFRIFKDQSSFDVCWASISLIFS